MYTKKQAELKAALIRSHRNGRVRSFERQFNTADAGGNPNAITIATQPGGDFFVDQFTVQILTYYFTVSGGVYTSVAASAIAAQLKTRVAAFLFGYADFQSGFPKAQSLLPLSGGWLYEAPFSYRGIASGATSFGNIDANVRAQLVVGDIVQPITAITAGPVNTAAFVVMRLSNGYYANMENALSSDVFSINKVRYQLSDNTQTAQFSNPIQLINQSLFGAAKTDNVDPTAYKQPQQFQAGIIDIGINQSFYKAIGWGTYVNYDVVNFSMSFFVNQTNRLR